MGGSDPIISGDAMAVLLGFFSILGAVIGSELTAGTRVVMFLVGVIVLYLGLVASSG